MPCSSASANAYPARDSAPPSPFRATSRLQGYFSPTSEATFFQSSGLLPANVVLMTKMSRFSMRDRRATSRSRPRRGSG